MKPDWKDAPEWAKWLAMDEGGEWWWFELKPHVEYESHTWHQTMGRTFKACSLPDWRETLESRPE